jgi:hypothetical protein
MNKDPTIETYSQIGAGYSFKPDKLYIRPSSEKSIINTIITRFATDCASIDIRHVRLDQQDRYLETINSKFNNCLTTEANIDQTGRNLFHDAVMSMLDEGVVAVVPTDTSLNPKVGSYDILTMRTGKIVQWYPEYVQIRMYNQKTGQKQEVTLPKKQVAIIENPFYQIMNAPNSTMQRLKRKLALLDVVDEQNASKKLNMIIQLPYTIKNELKRAEAEKRRTDMEKQLAESQYGVAYLDGTEKITQLNRALDTGLLEQVQKLKEEVLSQLGITWEILNGTANSETMTNYYTRIIEPIMTAFCEEYVRKFLTQTARTQKQSVKFFRDPFKLVPVDKMADLADKFTRNEILTSNEVRQIVGMLPSQDPNADALRNKNISMASDQEQLDINGNPIGPDMGMEEELPPEGMESPEALPPEEGTVQPQEAPQQQEPLPPQNGGEIDEEGFEDDPELDEIIANLTEEQFNQLSEEDQQVILDYIQWKEAKQNA